MLGEHMIPKGKSLTLLFHFFISVLISVIFMHLTTYNTVAQSIDMKKVRAGLKKMLEQEKKNRKKVVPSADELLDVLSKKIKVSDQKQVLAAGMFARYCLAANLAKTAQVTVCEYWTEDEIKKADLSYRQGMKGLGIALLRKGQCLLYLTPIKRGRAFEDLLKSVSEIIKNYSGR